MLCPAVFASKPWCETARDKLGLDNLATDLAYVNFRKHACIAVSRRFQLSY
jgi:hypothetical protein